MRIAVIGARRNRQGTGGFIARFLVEAGADVRVLVGTSEDTAGEAVRALDSATGHRARPTADLASVIEPESLDAVVIASPHASHAAYLDLALEHRLHVLCEKPVVWGGPDPAGHARRIGEAFLAAERHLVVNTQWPFTLPTFAALFPDHAGQPARFWMRMSPMTRGKAMLIDAIPHPLSLLQAAVGDGTPAAIRIDELEPSGDALRVAFDYVTAAGPVATVIELIRVPEPPRPAAYGFDGRIAHREIETADYRMFLRSDAQRVPLPDPTPLLVRSFVEAVAAGPPVEIDPAVVPGMDHLVAICDAYEDVGVSS